MKSTATLKTLLLVCVLLAPLPRIFGQSNSEKLTRDDKTEIFGHTSDVELPSDNRQAAPLAPMPTGEMGLRTNACASAFIMNTPYNSNNGQRGCMFDITAANTLTIRCFESNLYAGTTANYEIYYRPGTHVGFENNAAAWTMLGAVTGITSAGNNLPTALPIPINVTIPAGMTYSFYITNDFGGGTSYTDGTAVGNFLASDANLTIFEGVGKSYPFGLTFNVRNFNGHIFYDLGTALDEAEIELDAELTAEGPEVSWHIEDQVLFSQLSLERSTDGLHFAPIKTLPADKTGSHLDETTGTASTYFYRLQLQTPNGKIEYSDAVEIATVLDGDFQLAQAFPNPFSTDIQFDVENASGKDIRLEVFNQLGRKVYEHTFSGFKGTQKISPDFGHLTTGMYSVRFQAGQTVKTTSVIRL